MTCILARGSTRKDTKSDEEVLTRLRNDELEELVLTEFPFPTSFEEFQEAVIANTSVRTLQITIPTALEGDDLESLELRESYLSTLGALPHLKTVIFQGRWKDTHLTTFLNAMSPFHFYRLKLSSRGASWDVTSQASMTRLVHAIQALRFEWIDLCWIRRQTIDLDLTPLVTAMANRAKFVRLPMITVEDDHHCKLGRIPNDFRGAVVFENSLGSPRQRLHVGTRPKIVGQSPPRCQLSQLESLHPQEGRPSKLQELELFLSEEIADVQPLVSFCRRSPTLKKVQVHLVEQYQRMLTPNGLKHLSLVQPEIARAIDFEVSLNAAGIRQMLASHSFSRQEWIETMVQKRDNTSVLYYMLRQMPAVLVNSIR